MAVEVFRFECFADTSGKAESLRSQLQTEMDSYTPTTDAQNRNGTVSVLAPDGIFDNYRVSVEGAYATDQSSAIKDDIAAVLALSEFSTGITDILYKKHSCTHNDATPTQCTETDV